MAITDLRPDDDVRIRQTAELLMAAFRGTSDSWQTIESALEEVRESFGEGRISRVAIDDEGRAIGWIGGIAGYGGNAWELHPLAVHPAAQGRGVGAALVADLEERVRERGGVTLYLGTDDEDGRTSLYGLNLYPDVWEHLSRITNPGRHPYEFYLRQGFVITGVIPDANGPGRHDILMAKRVDGR
jgi:aminoglycoside 6'-N-acetyltransferase I